MFYMTIDGVELQMEHSLSSLSRWEAESTRPFIGSDTTAEDLLSYFKAMVVEPHGAVDLLDRAPQSEIERLGRYLSSSATATIIHEIQQKKPSKEIVTSELIYYWMVSFKIPFEADQWHLNRLMTLIRICGIKSQKPKKQPSGAVAQQMRDENARRRAAAGSKG